MPCVLWTHGGCGQVGLVSGSAQPGPCPSLLGMGSSSSKFLLIFSKAVGKEGISSQGSGKPCHSDLVHSLKKLLDLNTLHGDGGIRWLQSISKLLAV